MKQLFEFSVDLFHVFHQNNLFFCVFQEAGQIQNGERMHIKTSVSIK